MSCFNLTLLLESLVLMHMRFPLCGRMKHCCNNFRLLNQSSIESPNSTIALLQERQSQKILSATANLSELLLAKRAVNRCVHRKTIGQKIQVYVL
jgi:hypothetical protein